MVLGWEQFVLCTVGFVLFIRVFNELLGWIGQIRLIIPLAKFLLTPF